MSKELVISQKDFNEVGINAQLSVNDLVEVVANDIYEKYMGNIHEMVQKGNDLKKKYYSLFDPELNKMKLSLKEFISKDDPVSKVDDEGDEVDGNYEKVTQSFSRSNEYWQGGVDLKTICLTEKDKGTSVSTNSNYFSMPSLKNKNIQVKLTISSDKEKEIKEVSVGKIKGEIETSKEKRFTQIITTTTTRFKNLTEEVVEYNKQVRELMNYLPKNGLISVERFTREARVKMNKKIISSQSTDFRNKMSELFRIKL